MKKLIALLLCLTMLLVGVACNADGEVMSNTEDEAVTEPTNDTEAPTDNGKTQTENGEDQYLDNNSEMEDTIMKKHLNILFIGNSYTYFNNMPETYFKEAAEQAGYDVTVTAVTMGGAYLHQFADEALEQGKNLRKAISGVHYDVAIIQEQSVNPIKDEESFINGVRDIKALVDADNFVLYATWGRNVGSSLLDELSMTSEEMTEKLSHAYNKAADLYGMRVAEVGKAFLNYEERNALYDPDKSHPSATGSAIAARVIFGAVKSCFE